MPQLRVAGPNGEQWLDLEGDDFLIGRDPAAPITLQDRKVSRQHARIFRRGDAYFVEDLGSSNGVLSDGVPINGALQLDNGAEIEIGPFVLTFASDPEPEGTLTFALIGLNGPVDGQTYELPVADIVVGRGDENDIVIGDVSISREHAVLEVRAQGMMVEDLGSSNGTFVNDTRVAREPLMDGDTLRFGNIEFQVAAEENVAPAKPLIFAGALPGAKTLASLRRADNSVKLAMAMGALTVLLLMVVVAMLATRGLGPSQPEISPFDAYEKAIEKDLNTARAQVKSESWQQAERTFQNILDQDPVNEEARKGLLTAQENGEHQSVLTNAQDALRRREPEVAIQQLSAISSEAYYAQQATGIVKEARGLIAAQAALNAQESCRLRDWRKCHDEAITALSHNADDGVALGLVNEAERQLRAQNQPFTPWAP